MITTTTSHQASHIIRTRQWSIASRFAKLSSYIFLSITTAIFFLIGFNRGHWGYLFIVVPVEISLPLSPPLSEMRESWWTSNRPTYRGGRVHLQCQVVGAEQDAWGSHSAVQETISARSTTWVWWMVGIWWTWTKAGSWQVCWIKKKIPFLMLTNVLWNRCIVAQYQPCVDTR